MELPDTFQRTATPSDMISYILAKTVEKDARQSIGRWPARAIALHAWTTACRNPIEGAAYVRTQGKTRIRLYVKAHIPEVHSSIPLPDKLGPPKGMNPRDRIRLGMHHTFVADLDDVSLADIPSIGDIILVDYDNRSRLTGGMYKGIAERGPGSIVDVSSPAFSGRRYFEKSRTRRLKPKNMLTKRERFLNADFYQHPLTLADYQT
tara:strand:+ start:2007 stop:2624 length:618 start_codon:yes stop_codon:yes gene_type:complete